ncbi:transketolase C-terminal domain-containing protein, partial [Bacillus safensis]|uniref:transketolase C-terminal domain-containing protein n=1 Tax=Bacillus safensis TaxID=561879 RepID=UPI002DD42139
PLPQLWRTADGVDILHASGETVEPAAGTAGVRADVLFVAVGPMTRIALDAAAILAESDITATVVDPRWVIPVAESVVALANTHRL